MQQRHDIATHAATVALTPSRVLTSYLRKRGMKPFHVLSGMVVSCFVYTALYLWFIPSPLAKPWRIQLRTPSSLQTLIPMPVEAIVTCVDERGCPSARLKWVLPESAQSLMLETSTSTDFEIQPMKKNEQTFMRSRWIFYSSGSEQQIGIELRTNKGVIAGKDSRAIEDIPLELNPVAQGVTDDVMVYRVTNRSEHSIEDLELLQNGIQSQSTVLSRIGPGEDRLILIKLENTQSNLKLLSHGYEVLSRIDTFAKIDRPNATIVNVSATSGMLAIDTQQTQESQLFISTSTYYQISLREGQMTTVIKKQTSDEQPHLLALVSVEEGITTLEDVMIWEDVRAPKLFVEARYTSKSGDQLGTGPWPPEPMKESRYWVQFRLDLSSREMKNCLIRSELPRGAYYTGYSALPFGGELLQSGNAIEYQAENLLANTMVAVQFELAQTPSASSTELLGVTNLQCVDEKTGTIVSDQFDVMSIASPKL